MAQEGSKRASESPRWPPRSLKKAQHDEADGDGDGDDDDDDDDDDVLEPCWAILSHVGLS